MQQVRTGTALASFVALGALPLVGGCARICATSPTRSAQEMLLITMAADRAGEARRTKFPQTSPRSSIPLGSRPRIEDACCVVASGL
jgi:hypothetical protein